MTQLEIVCYGVLIGGALTAFFYCCCLKGGCSDILDGLSNACETLSGCCDEGPVLPQQATELMAAVHQDQNSLISNNNEDEGQLVDNRRDGEELGTGSAQASL